jgi:GMP synthase (glutamine-hydrolysing)
MMISPAALAKYGKEIGFHPIALNDNGATSPLRHVNDVPVLHWHGDTFTLPQGVELLGSSSAYRHQAFRRGKTLLALQFHAEMGEDPRFDAWIAEAPDTLAGAGICARALRAAHEQHGSTAVAAGRRMIAEWLTALPN